MNNITAIDDDETKALERVADTLADNLIPYLKGIIKRVNSPHPYWLAYSIAAGKRLENDNLVNYAKVVMARKEPTERVPNSLVFYVGADKSLKFSEKYSDI